MADARKMVNHWMDAGVNFFDTANIYSKGMAEEILAQTINGLQQKVLISTKSNKFNNWASANETR